MDSINTHDGTAGQEPAEHTQAMLDKAAELEKITIQTDLIGYQKSLKLLKLWLRRTQRWKLN